MRRVLPVIAVAAIAAALFLGAGIGFPMTRDAESPGASSPGLVRHPADLPASISSLQAHLRTQPRDAESWAALGAAYVAQARATSDPTYYPKAEQALQRSFTEQATDNFPAATGMAALAAARHDFPAALRWADRSLEVNPRSVSTLAVRTDALVELGRYTEAASTARRADATEPGEATFARLSYLAELHGDIPEAARLMGLALQDAGTPDDKAFASFHLGQLARQTGDLSTAAQYFAAALKAEPTYIPALAGQAHLAAARGAAEEAVAGYAAVVDRMPLPEYLLAYGELLQSLGRDDEASQQYAVVEAYAELARANGVNADLELAHYEADHGSAQQALTTARAEWSRRHSISAADALGWAFHAAGRDREAVRYLTQATRLGTKDARVLYHLGIAQLGAGDRAAARRTLHKALALEPTFSPLYAPAARRALAALEAS